MIEQFLRGMDVPDFSSRRVATFARGILLYEDISDSDRFAYKLDVNGSELEVSSETDISEELTGAFINRKKVEIPFTFGADTHLRRPPIHTDCLYLKIDGKRIPLTSAKYRN